MVDYGYLDLTCGYIHKMHLLPWGMWPYFGYFQLHIHLWLLDRLKNCLINFAIANHKDYHFKFENWFRDAKNHKRSKWVFSCFLNDHIGCCNCVHHWTKNSVSFWSSNKSNMIVTNVFMKSILDYKACHIQLKNRCLIQKTLKLPIDIPRLSTMAQDSRKRRGQNSQKQILYLDFLNCTFHIT